MMLRIPILAIALASLSLSAWGDDYVGILRPSRAALAAPAGLYSFSTISSPGFSSAATPESALRLKLGYKYSRFLAVEGEFNDLARAPADPFAAAPTLASPFRSTGFGVNTIATLPVWRFSFYGRMGAYHGEPRYAFSNYSTSLLADGAARTRWRYGLGMRYDFTSALGIRAELEHYSPLGSPLATEGGDADLFSVGLSWRF